METSRVSGSGNYLAFALGSTVGGVIAAVALLVPVGMIAREFIPAQLSVAAGVAVVAAVVPALANLVELPRIHRQARQSLGNLPPTLGLFMFGLDLGAGVRTYTSSLALYLLLLPPVLGADPWALVGAGAAFGAVRGLVPLDRALYANGRQWDVLLSGNSLLPAGAPWIAVAVAVSLLALGRG